MLYKYRGTDPDHKDNVSRKLAMQDQRPLIFFHRVIKGKYLVHWPVNIVGANDNTLTFTVEADRTDSIRFESSQYLVQEPDEARRKYVTYSMKEFMSPGAQIVQIGISWQQDLRSSERLSKIIIPESHKRYHMVYAKIMATG